MPIEALIDADGLVYAAGFACENESLGICLKTVDSMLYEIAAQTQADDAYLYLTGSTNFRDDIATIQKYKGNREGAKKPKWYKEIREHMQKAYQCIVSEGMEADDMLGIAMCSEAATQGDIECVCVSIDKDMLMIPGHHYNWKKKEHRLIDEKEALSNFLVQMLTGDSTDNIPGLYKLTGDKATAGRKQTVCNALYVGPEEAWGSVLRYYLTGTKPATEAQVEEIADLLWIKRGFDSSWRDIFEPTKEA